MKSRRIDCTNNVSGSPLACSVSILLAETHAHIGSERFESERAVFADGRSEAFDQIVLATGYEPAIDRLLPGVRDLLDTRGLPPLAGAGANDGLFFLGFSAYAAGGLLRSIRLDAPRIAASVASRHHGGDEGRGGDR